MRAHFKKARFPANARWGGVYAAPQGNKNMLRSRGGACPARDLTAMIILRVICRGGIYAARRSHPGNET